MIQLLPGESIITESDAKLVTLTTHRIAYHDKSSGNMLSQHIMLEHITSTEVTKSSSQLLLIIAAIFGIWGLYVFVTATGNDAIIPLLLAIICALIYWFTRKKTIIIASPSLKMKIVADNMSNERIFDFISKVEYAIVNRSKNQASNMPQTL